MAAHETDAQLASGSNPRAVQGLQFREPLLFERSSAGRRGHSLPASSKVDGEVAIPASLLRKKAPAWPELSEPEVVRHFVRLSHQNYAIDVGFFPLGSCTMKYNPKRNERVAAMPGFAEIHPLQPDDTVQGMLRLLYELQSMLAEISGLPCVSHQPAAGAHGELAALMVAAKHFRKQGANRTKVLAPDSAHGTNPASARMAGFSFVTVKSNEDGMVDLADLQSKLDDEIAVFMITNPNTLGLFDAQVRQIAESVHAKGGLIYLDGANMNAILGVTRPGDFGADMMHFNPHKTFSGPHGGGGPGAGPICVTEELGPYLPIPRVTESDGVYVLDVAQPDTIGKVRSFFGNVGVLVRAYCYILSHGPEGLKRVTENAVLNANYLLSKVKHILDVPHGDRCMHEFVASVKDLKKSHKIKAYDVGKALLDKGFHSPTIYFPLIVEEALMFEPTETQSKETLDDLAENLKLIVDDLQKDDTVLEDYPKNLPVGRPNELIPAKYLTVNWGDFELLEITE